MVCTSADVLLSMPRCADEAVRQSSSGIKVAIEKKIVAAGEVHLMRGGFKHIDIETFMGNQLPGGCTLEKRCMVGAWASMLNHGRKGDAKAVWELGVKGFGEEEFELAVEQCLKYAARGGDDESGSGNMKVSGK